MTSTAIIILSSRSSIPLLDWNLHTQIIHRIGPEQISTNVEMVAGWASTGNIGSASSTTDQEKYSALFSAIEELSSLDEEDSHFIDNCTARAARHFLSLLSLYSVAAPQIFPHGGDAVVCKWSLADEITAYVTVADEVVSLHKYRSGSPLSPPMSFTSMSEQELIALMLQLGGNNGGR